MSCYCQAELNSINWTPHWHCDSTLSEPRLHLSCTAFPCDTWLAPELNSMFGTKLCHYRAIVSVYLIQFGAAEAQRLKLAL